VPNTRSAAKQMRVAERRRLRNRMVKSAVKTFIRKAERTIVESVDEAQAQIVQAIKSLDKAASKGILHKNNVARRKSRLMKKYNVAVAAATAAPADAAEAAPAAKRSAARKPASGGARARTTRKK
jgi:small subunit ribosomal protein S20